MLMSVSKIDCASQVLARTTVRQLKHAMNSVGDEVHRFALPEGATQTAIKTRIGLRGWTLGFTVLFTDSLYSREAVFSVSSSLHRDRVMEARFDRNILQLPNRARAIDGVMFRREAWVVQSMLNIRASCQVMPYGPGGPSGEWVLEFTS